MLMAMDIGKEATAEQRTSYGDHLDGTCMLLQA